VGGDSIPAYWFPPRPKFMKRKYYERLREQFHRLDAEGEAAANDWFFGRGRPGRKGSAGRRGAPEPG
jgi:hypothetical protein